MKKKKTITAEIINVRLSKESKKSVRAWERSRKKAKACLRSLYGDTVREIENGRRHRPVSGYDFADIKETREKGYHDFSGIPENAFAETDSLDTGILSFGKEAYPEYECPFGMPKADVFSV